MLLRISFREFPGGLVVRILGFHCHGAGSIPGQGTENPQAVRRGQKKKNFYFLYYYPVYYIPKKSKSLRAEGQSAKTKLSE